MPDDFRSPILTAREPPCNLEAEQALLGALLVNNRSHERVSEILRPEHFADPVNGRIYEVVARTIDGGGAASPITLKGAFDGDPALAHVGGAKYLMRLAGAVVTVINAGEYAREIRDCYLRRRLIDVGEGIINAAHDRADSTATAVIETAESNLFGLAERDNSGGLAAVGDDVDDAMAHVDAASKNGGKLLGASTGLNALDNGSGGLLAPDLIVLAARPSMGKAQPLDARVLGADGEWMRLGDLRLGDKLASVDGRPSIVTGLFPQGIRQVYRITLADGRSCEACAEHLWRVSHRKWDAPRVLQTSDLVALLSKKWNAGRVWIETLSGHFGHAEELPIDPWMLGALIGNGCMVHGGTPSFSTKDGETLWRMMQSASEMGIAVNHSAAYDYRLTNAAGRAQAGHQGVVANPLMAALRSLGMDSPSTAKRIPHQYMTAHRGARLELLRGLIDTDGWVEKHGAVQYSTSSKGLAEDVVALVRSLGGLCTLREKAPHYTYKGERKAGQPHYICGIRHTDAASLMLLHRKRERVADVRTPRLSIESIVPSRETETACIAVSHPDHLYVTDDYIVTHNTSLARQIAYNVARNTGPVAFFSLEMSRKQQNLSLLAALANIPVSDVLHGNVGDGWPALQAAAAGLKRVPLHIDDRPGMRVSQIRSACRRMKRRHGLALVVIDYLQLMQPEGRAESQNVAVSQISGGLKGLAKELDVPVLVLSQLNRGVEQRDDKRPTLSDLRDSGAIEQDADMVWMLYRAEYYLRREEPEQGAKNYYDKLADWRAKIDPVKGKAEVDVAKRRMGPLGRVDLRFLGQTTAFGDPR